MMEDRNEQRKRFKWKHAQALCWENSLKKTPLFEFEVPSYRKRPVGLAAIINNQDKEILEAHQT